jgi:alpha-L-rhamnosidase
MTALHPAFQRETVLPHPNWRLPESNILFDARQVGPLLKTTFHFSVFRSTTWKRQLFFSRKKINEAEKRPIPFWKDFGLKKYDNSPSLPLQSQGDTLVLDLPYNAQITPFFRIKSPEGLKIDIRTDNYKGGSEYNVRTEYITQAGEQVFETPGWMNGHRVRYHFPEGIQVLDLQYRESGYATEFAGAFQCDDPFLTNYGKKHGERFTSPCATITWTAPTGSEPNGGVM